LGLRHNGSIDPLPCPTVHPPHLPLAERLRLRRMPRIHYAFDDTEAEAAKIIDPALRKKALDVRAEIAGTVRGEVLSQLEVVRDA